MKKIAISIVLFFVVIVTVHAQTGTVQPITGTEGFISYKIFPSNSGVVVKPGSFVKWDIQNYIGNDLQSDSRTNIPVFTQLDTNSIPADYLKIFLKAHKGDSLALTIPIDSATKATPNATHDGKIGYIFIKLLDIFDTQDQANTDQAIENKKMAIKDSLHAIQQRVVDGKLIQQYATQKGLKGFTTKSGLYIFIKNKGTGKPILKGEKVKVNYTGSSLDGNVFDSNIDPKFSHVTPYEVSVGTGSVIRGWDEALQLLTRGSEGTVIIPSDLAYGRGGAGSAIGPDAILAFDLKVLDDAPAVTPKPKPLAPTKVKAKPQAKTKH